ncbi:unnamed protein product, partial [Diamesa tonsa]
IMDWFDLPEYLWITILEQLDVKTRLKLSETCSTFNNLLFNTVLSKRMKLRIDLRRETHLVNIFENSNRKYKSVKCLHVSEYLGKPSADFEVMLQILNRFSDSIREIRIICIKISCTNWNRLLQSLKYVETFDLFLMTFYQPPTRITGIENSVLKFDALSMIRCDLRYLDIFDGSSVYKMELRAKNDHINNYIPFLKKQEELKSLSADISMLFENDKLKKVKFSLEFLDLYNARWSNKQSALNFIRTQTKLRKVLL